MALRCQLRKLNLRHLQHILGIKYRYASNSTFRESEKSRIFERRKSTLKTLGHGLGVIKRIEAPEESRKLINKIREIENPNEVIDLISNNTGKSLIFNKHFWFFDFVLKATLENDLLKNHGC